MRMAGLILASAFCFAGPDQTRPAAEVQEEAKSFPAQPGDTLVIQNDYGRIRISAGDPAQCEVKIRKHPNVQAGKDAVRVAAIKSGSRIFLYSFFSGLGGESVDLEIRAPILMNVAIWGANPDIEVRGLGGFVRAQNFTGPISAEDLNGSVSLLSESGEISYRVETQPQGDIRLETSSGSIRCELSRGLNLRAWLRAGGAISWDKEAEVRGSSLEKQLGTFGPLVYAGSLKGDISVTLIGGPSPSPVPPGNPPPAPTEPEAVERKPDIGAGAPDGASVPRQRLPAPVKSPESAPPKPAPPAEERPAPIAGGYSLKIDVDSVFLNVSVRDRYTGRSIPDLGPQDFLVYEDGVPQVLEQLISNDAPFNLLLLLDISGSTRSFLHLMKQASIDFTRQIKSNDRIAIAAFNSQVELIQDFTNDRAEVTRAIGRINSNGGTAFYDALLRCVDSYMRGIEGRSAIVVFTDGVDNQLEGRNSEGSRTPFAQLYHRIQEIDPIIYTIFLDTEGSGLTQAPAGTSGTGAVIGILGGILRGGRQAGGYPPRYPTSTGGRIDRRAIYDEAYEQLVSIAEQTGGRMYSPNRIEDLARVYGEIADDLRIQYQLGYNSSNRARDGKWRQVRVQVRNQPDASVRTRKGYYARKDRDSLRP